MQLMHPLPERMTSWFSAAHAWKSVISELISVFPPSMNNAGVSESGPVARCLFDLLGLSVFLGLMGGGSRLIDNEGMNNYEHSDFSCPTYHPQVTLRHISCDAKDQDTTR